MQFLKKIRKELMKTCEPSVILSIALVKKNTKKSAYDSGCYMCPLILAEHQQQAYVY